MGKTYGSQNFWIREAMMRGARLQDDGRVHIRIFCDGTFGFGQEAARLLHNAGCQNLTIESKIVSPHPRFPKWMTCLFDASGTHPAWPDEMPEIKTEWDDEGELPFNRLENFNMKNINHAHDLIKLEDILSVNFDSSHLIITLTYCNKYPPMGKTVSHE